jgi:hypothetical protein
MTSAIELPPQLAVGGYRFIKLGSSGERLKIPIEMGWNIFNLEELDNYFKDRQKKWDEAEATGKHEELRANRKFVSKRPVFRGRLNNYAYNEPEFVEWLRRGNNYGVTAAGGLIKLESDDIPRWQELGILDLLPDTFTVQSSSPNRQHFYYEGPEVADASLKDPDTGEDIGHIRGTGEDGGRGGMVVGPGSLHPHNVRYTVVKDLPIAKLSEESLDKVKSILCGKTSQTSQSSQPNDKKHQEKARTASSADYKDPFKNVTISAVLGAHYHDFHPEGSQMAGPNPYGSHTNHNGRCLVIESGDREFYCFECEQGGGVSRLIAIRAGIMRCAERGAPTGQEWWDTIRYALNEGLIDEETAKAAGLGGQAPRSDSSNQKERACIKLCGDLIRNEDEVLAALYAYNSPPTIYQRGGSLCRVKQISEYRYKIEDLTDYALRNEISKAATFQKFIPKKDDDKEEFAGKKGSKLLAIPCEPPINLVRGIMALDAWDIPYINGLISAPVVRADGSLLLEPGYDEATGLCYRPDATLALSRIPENPTKKDAEAAAKLIVDEVLHDFPFVDNASKAGALAAFLTPIIRPMIRGCVPLCLVDKPSPGTGASKLLDLVSIVATGRAMAALSPPGDEEEWRKLITGLMRDGAALACIDNIASDLKADALSRVLSSAIWKDRTLGKPDAVEYPQRACWYATGNNLTLSGDLPRRSHLIQLDAKLARPWERTTFKHANINQWVAENRGRLLAALLTMARGWVVAGSPNGGCKSIVGGFDEWVSIVGGILSFAGISGFLGNLSKLYEEVDVGSDEWAEFFQAWYAWNKAGVTSNGVLEQMRNPYTDLAKCAPSEIAEKIKYHSAGDAKKVGIALRKKLNVRYKNGLMLSQEFDTHLNQKVWKVAIVENHTIGAVV